jgi:hypothetical protein
MYVGQDNQYRTEAWRERLARNQGVMIHECYTRYSAYLLVIYTQPAMLNGKSHLATPRTAPHGRMQLWLLSRVWSLCWGNMGEVVDIGRYSGMCNEFGHDFQTNGRVSQQQLAKWGYGGTIP